MALAPHAADRSVYTRTAIILHWAIALLLLFNIGFGFFMEGFAPPLRGVVVPLHISSGITVLALTLVRVLWRLLHAPPPYPADMKRWERDAAHIAHFLLYAGMVLMPLTGWAIISAHPPAGSPGAAVEARSMPAPPPNAPRGRSVIKIWGVVPLPSIRPIQAIGASAGGVEPQKELHDEFVAWHSLGGWILIALLVLHVAGALKHQILDRHAELARMGIGKAGPVAAD